MILQAFRWYLQQQNAAHVAWEWLEQRDTVLVVALLGALRVIYLCSAQPVIPQGLKRMPSLS